MIIRIIALSVPTKPLNDAQMRGAFLYIYVYSQNTPMERLPHFMKHYMTGGRLDGSVEKSWTCHFRLRTAIATHILHHGFWVSC